MSSNAEYLFAMRTSVRVFYGTAEHMDLVRQLADVFGNELTKQAEPLEDFENISELAFSPITSHPAVTDHNKPRRSFDKATGTYFIDAPVDYCALVSMDWRIRIEAFALGLREACPRIAKTKISNDEVEAVQAAIAVAQGIVTTQPPTSIESAEPIYIFKDQTGAVTSVAYQKHEFQDFSKAIEVPPEAAIKFADAASFEPQDEPQMFKLYKKSGKSIDYREAWFADGMVVEHFGSCGDPGGTRDHPVSDEAEAKRVLNTLRKDARGAGFSSIPPSRHTTLVVEFDIDGFGTGDDLDRRHMLEEQLDQLVGWLGLGHCDGGSIGSGTMEIFLEVVNYTIAHEALESRMAEIAPGVPFRIYRMK